MVVILPQQDTFGSKFSKAFNPALQDSLGQYMKQAQEKKELEREKVKQQHQAEALGIDPRVLDPALQKALLDRQTKENEFKQFSSILGLGGEQQGQPQEQPQQSMGGIPDFSQMSQQSEGPLNFSNQPQMQQSPMQQPQQGQQPPDLKNLWKNLDSAKKAMFAQKFPNAAKQFQAEDDILRREKIESNKDIRESYKDNNEFINKTHTSFEDSFRKEAIIDRMTQLNQGDQISDSGMVNFLETMGLDPQLLKNPANDEYTKLALDLLGGGTLQADYGSKLFASEFATSLKRIPTLNTTKEGRAQIAENMKTALLPARLKEERLQYYIDKADREGKPLPHDLHGRIIKDIRPQLEQNYQKFKERNGRIPVKKGSVPDDNALEKYYFLSDGDEKKAFKMMSEDGYDIDA